MIERQNNLEGHLVGIGVVHKDGSRDYKWLDKPVHNTIVKSGIDHLLRWNGTDYYHGESNNNGNPPWFYSSNWTYGNSDKHYGIFSYMAIGTGTSATTINMTSLENPISVGGEIYHRRVKSNLPFTGMYVVSNGKYKFRMTQVSSAVESEVVVSEFGLFGRYGDAAPYTYPMFCRIVIPELLRPHLQTGESVEFTYELNWDNEFSGEPKDIGNLNIIDTEGQNIGICAEARCYTDTYRGGLVLTASGGDSGNQGSTLYFENPVWCGTNNSSTNDCVNSNVIQYSTDPRRVFPTSINNEDTSYMTLYNTSVLYSQIKLLPYTESGIRTYYMKLINASNSEINMYYLRHRGIDYRFYKMINGVKTYSPIVFAPGSVLQLNFRVSYIATSSN